MGTERKADWHKTAKNYGDNPKLKGLDRRTKHSEEYWERIHVKSHTRKLNGKRFKVRAYTRKPS